MIHNNSQVLLETQNIPQPFIDSIITSIEKAEYYLKDRFGIDFYFSNKIVLRDISQESQQNNCRIAAEYENLIHDIKNIIPKIKDREIAHLFNDLIEIFFLEYNGINQQEGTRTSEQIIDRIEYWLRRYKKYSRRERFRFEDEPYYVSLIEKPILDAPINEMDSTSIEPITNILSRVKSFEYPMIVLGEYLPESKNIVLYYKSITDSAANKNFTIEELGINVLSHEMFHAAHFNLMNQSKVLERHYRDQNEIRKNAVLETLAQYCCIRFSKEIQFQDELYAWNIQNSTSRPFPKWGYAGGAILNNAFENRMQNNLNAYNIHNQSLRILDFDFNAVYYTSLYDKQDAYNLISSIQKDIL